MRRALVTGSSGLVGGETVRLLCDNGFKVFGLDNNLRHRFVGEEANTELQRQSLDHELLSFAPLAADIRGTEAVEQLFRYYGPFDLIVHSAAQPAHGWATDHPLEDFQITAFGTLVLLENYRRWSPDAVFIQVSSSRVYGSPIADLPVQELDTRYDLPADHRFFEGIDESIGLDHSTRSLFGVSKTSGDLAASARPSSGRPIPPGSLSTTTTRSSESCAGTGWTRHRRLPAAVCRSVASGAAPGPGTGRADSRSRHLSRSSRRPIPAIGGVPHAHPVPVDQLARQPEQPSPAAPSSGNVGRARRTAIGHAAAAAAGAPGGKLPVGLASGRPG